MRESKRSKLTEDESIIVTLDSLFGEMQFFNSAASKSPIACNGQKGFIAVLQDDITLEKDCVSVIYPLIAGTGRHTYQFRGTCMLIPNHSTREETDTPNTCTIKTIITQRITRDRNKTEHFAFLQSDGRRVVEIAHKSLPKDRDSYLLDNKMSCYRVGSDIPLIEGWCSLNVQFSPNERGVHEVSQITCLYYIKCTIDDYANTKYKVRSWTNHGSEASSMHYSPRIVIFRKGKYDKVCISDRLTRILPIEINSCFDERDIMENFASYIDSMSVKFIHWYGAFSGKGKLFSSRISSCAMTKWHVSKFKLTGSPMPTTNGYANRIISVFSGRHIFDPLVGVQTMQKGKLHRIDRHDIVGVAHRIMDDKMKTMETRITNCTSKAESYISSGIINVLTTIMIDNHLDWSTFILDMAFSANSSILSVDKLSKGHSSTYISAKAIKYQLMSNACHGHSLKCAKIVDRQIGITYMKSLHSFRKACKKWKRKDGGRIGFSGGFVMDPISGLYQNSLATLYDLASMYPSIMETQIVKKKGYNGEHDDKFSSIMADVAGNAIKQRNNWKAKVRECKYELKRLSKETSQSKTSLSRKIARINNIKSKYYRMERKYKVIQNAYYGATGMNGYEFYAPEYAGLITLIGRNCIKAIASECTENGWKIIYGDTDSVLVSVPLADDPTETATLIKTIEKKIQLFVMEMFKGMSIKCDGIYYPFVLCRKKQYFGREMDIDSFYKNARAAMAIGEGSIAIKGLKCIRGDQCEISAKSQRRLIDSIVNITLKRRMSLVGGSPNQHPISLRKQLGPIIVDILKKNKFGGVDGDNKHVYAIWKKLTKMPEDYGNDIPHVKVAQMMLEVGQLVHIGDSISYIVCNSSYADKKRTISDRVKRPQLCAPTDVDLRYYHSSIASALMQILQHVFGKTASGLIPRYDALGK